MSVATLGLLVVTGCRTQAVVQALGAEAVAALPGAAPQEVAAYLLRKPLGYGSEVIGGESLWSLLQAGFRTKADVLTLGEQAVAGLPGAAAQEVATWQREQVA